MEKKKTYAYLTQKTGEIARKAGNYILLQQKKFSLRDIENKGKNHLVSYVDRQAEEIIVHALKKLLPEAGFITEEETISTEKKSLVWIIDPLDGTTNFVHKVPVFGVSIALTEGKRISLGVVYEVNSGSLFSACRGGGATCNKKRIAVSPVKKLSDSLLATGFPYERFERKDGYLKCLSYFMQNSHGIRRLGSASIDLCYVACGIFGGFFEYNLSPWDIAAGCCIVEEAGGKITDFSGGDNCLFGKEIIASNSLIHGEMMRRIRKYMRGAASLT